MSALLLPFATRVMDSHLVSPDEVPVVLRAIVYVQAATGP